MIFWQKQKERNIEQLQAIIDGRDADTSKMDNYFASQIKPKTFYGRRNEELRYDREFEKNCIVLASYANKPVKELTTKEYFALIEHHNKMITQQRGSVKKGK